MSLVGIVGFLASAVAIVSFMPQALKVWRSRHAHDLSLASFLLLEVGGVLWLAYGLLTRDTPIILTNGVIGLLVFFILSFKLRYG